MRIPLFLVLIATCAHTLRADASVDDSSAASHIDETISAAGQTAALQQPQPPAVSAASPKTKRGIFHHHAAHQTHGLTYNVPLGTAAYPHYGFQKPWHQISYAKVPLHHHHVHLAATAPSFLAAGPAVVPTASIVHHHHAVPPPPPPAVLTAHAHFVHPAPPPPPPPQQPHHHPHYIVSPGSAAVSSYNVNYPRYPYYGHSRPHIDVPAVVAVRPAPPPAVLVRPAAPLPIGAGASIVPTFANRIPIGRPFTGFAPQSHHHHFVPTASTQTVYTQTGPVGGLYPIAPAVHHHHAAGVQPPHAHFVPALPGGATVATFPATAAVAPTIASGTFDQWHPIYVANSNPATVFPTLQPTPTTSTVSVNANGQPASDLLPPFGSAPAGAGAGSSSVLDEQSAAALFQQQLQQQQYENAVAAAAEYTAEHQQQQQQLQQQQQQQQYQSQVSHQLYGPPSDNQLDAGQEYVQASQQLQQQQQQQRAIIEEQQQIHSAGAFNGQGLEAPSNNGHYAGPSSYEVQLNSYTRAI